MQGGGDDASRLECAGNFGSVRLYENGDPCPELGGILAGGEEVLQGLRRGAKTGGVDLKEGVAQREGSALFDSLLDSRLENLLPVALHQRLLL